MDNVPREALNSYTACGGQTWSKDSKAASSTAAQIPVTSTQPNVFREHLTSTIHKHLYICKALLAQTYSLSYVSALPVVSRLRATALQLNKILSTYKTSYLISFFIFLLLM